MGYQLEIYDVDEPSGDMNGTVMSFAANDRLTKAITAGAFGTVPFERIIEIHCCFGTAEEEITIRT
jgi:hypothetical protein